MKTRDRILHTSRDLFNAEGEAHQTAVDIANALDISPGNLYYHFKGKDAIIHALFEEFEEEMMVIFRGSRGALRSIEDGWVYTYILLEEIYDFRFFYRNLGALLARYPDLSRRFGVLIEEKRAAISAFITSLEKLESINIQPLMVDMITEQMLSTATFWLSMDQIENRGLPAPHLIHRTVYQMITLLVPYMGERGIDMLDTLTTYYEDAVKRA